MNPRRCSVSGRGFVTGGGAVRRGAAVAVLLGPRSLGGGEGGFHRFLVAPLGLLQRSLAVQLARERLVDPRDRPGPAKGASHPARTARPVGPTGGRQWLRRDQRPDERGGPSPAGGRDHPPEERRPPPGRGKGARHAWCYGRARISRSAGGYLVSSATRRSTSSSTLPVLGRLRLPASSASSVLFR